MRQVDALVCYVVHIKELAAWYATLFELLLRVAFACTAVNESLPKLSESAAAALRTAYVAG